MSHRGPSSKAMVLSTRLLAVEVALIVALGLLVLGGVRLPAGPSLSWFRVVHIAGAVIALGNFIAGAFLMAFTGRTRRRSIYGFVSEALQWSEVVLSAPGVMLLLYGGGVLANASGGLSSAAWLRASTSLAMASGLVWIGVLVPLQHRLIQLSRDEQDAERWERLARAYSIPGSLAGVATLVTLVLMVLKPALA